LNTYTPSTKLDLQMVKITELAKKIQEQMEAEIKKIMLESQKNFNYQNYKTMGRPKGQGEKVRRLTQMNVENQKKKFHGYPLSFWINKKRNGEITLKALSSIAGTTEETMRYYLESEASK